MSHCSCFLPMLFIPIPVVMMGNTWTLAAEEIFLRFVVWVSRVFHSRLLIKAAFSNPSDVMPSFIAHINLADYICPISHIKTHN